MIEVQVQGSLEKAIFLLKKQCISTRLVSDMNKHTRYEKRSTRRRIKHLKAMLKQRDKNKKMERKKQY